MRPLRNLPLMLLLLMAIQGIGRAQSPDDKRLGITREVMEDFAHDRLADVRGRFSADLKHSVSESDLKDAKDGLTEVAGGFQAQISQTTRMFEGAPLYVSKSQFQRHKVELKLTFDDSNQITYLRIAALSDLSPESMEASAREIADLLRQRQFDAVSAKFNERMKGIMPTDRLEASWVHVLMHLGAFKGTKAPRKDLESDSVDVRCEFENGPMIVRVAFDLVGKVSGLWMLPAETDRDSQI